MKYNLLIVDDEKYTLEDIEACLDREKLSLERVYTCLNIQRASQILAEDKIHIVLTDIDMPGGNGLLLVKEIREKYPDIRCVLITCHADFSYAQEAVKLNCLDYLLKPVDVRELHEVIKKAEALLAQKLHSEIKYEGYRPLRELLVMEYAEAEKEAKDYVALAAAYIDENLTNGVSRETAAEYVYVTPDHLDRLFRKKLGVSVHRYISDRKIALAEDLLAHSDVPVGRIGADLGFSNMSNFAQAFKRANGLNPNEFRKKTRG